jgi:hypothetical protein
MTFVRKIQIAVAGSILGLLALAGGLFIALNGGPGSEDSGVVACKEIVENAKSPSTGTPAKMTDAQRLEKRKSFEDSEHVDLQTAGTGFVEAVYKVDNLPTESTNTDTAVAAGEELGTAMGSTTLLFTQYELLKTACGNHGVELPSLS